MRESSTFFSHTHLPLSHATDEQKLICQDRLGTNAHTQQETDCGLFLYTVRSSSSSSNRISSRGGLLQWGLLRGTAPAAG